MPDFIRDAAEAAKQAVKRAGQEALNARRRNDAPPVSSNGISLESFQTQPWEPPGDTQYPALGFSDKTALDLEVTKPNDFQAQRGLFGDTGPVSGFGGFGQPQKVTVGQWLTDFNGLGRNQISTYQALLVRAGYLDPADVKSVGRSDYETLKSMRDALADAARNNMSPEAWLSEIGDRNEQQSRRGGGGGGRARPALQLQVSNRDDLKTLLDNAAQSVIGRNLESLGINPDEFADAVQAAERDIQTRSFNMQVNNQPGEIEQIESASARARRFLEDKAAPQIEARQMAGAMSVIENLVRGG